MSKSPFLNRFGIGFISCALFFVLAGPALAQTTPLQASFSYNPASPLAGQAVQFTDTSTGNPTSWEWHFGDGSRSTAQNPSHTYATADTRTVTLTVMDANGEDHISQIVTVGEAELKASFRYRPATPAAGQSVQFTDTSTGTPTSWSWSFGDGSTSTLKNPRHTFMTAGPRRVTLTAANGSGSMSTSRTVSVAAGLSAAFTYSPTAPTAGQTVQFTDTSTGNPTSWEWHFGDGSRSTAQNPSHSYDTPDTRTVTLTVIGANGEDSISRTVTIGEAGITASFTFNPTSPVAGRTVQFTDTSTGSPASWAWDFGDGSAGVSPNPAHTYEFVGSYMVTLTATNASGSSRASQTVRVTAALAASFTCNPTSPTAGQTVQFTDTSTGSPTSWAWDFGDGSAGVSPNPTHAFTAAGSYQVTLAVQNATESRSINQTIAVGEAGPRASFAYSPASPVSGEPVQFTDTSTGTPTSWSWSFGDGSTSSLQNPTHTFATAGSKMVTLTAAVASGPETVSDMIEVEAGLAASFTYSPASPVAGKPVQFTDTSRGTPTSWSWSFGDGSTSTVQNPTHTFTTARSTVVTLTATSTSGSKSATRTVTIEAELTALFAYSPTAPVAGEPVQFTDTSTGTPTSWSWSFGDGSTSSLQNPTHAYTTAGSRTVTLTAANASGSMGTSRVLTVAEEGLSASFTYTPASPAAGQPVQFADASTGKPTSWEWHFGDGSRSAAQNPSHTYSTADVRTVTLTAMKANGEDSISRIITVGETGFTASFTYSPASPVAGQRVQFTDTSTGTPTSWSWSFGDGSTSSLQNPTHAFATAGAKTVTLTTTNASGSNSTTRTMTVGAATAASFTYNPTSPAAGQSVQFTDTSTGTPTSWTWSFGDGSTSTAQHPSHTFASSDSYSVTLTVTDGSTSNTASQVLDVSPASSLSASFSYSPGSPRPSQSVQFTDTSTGTPTSWSWSFGDGTTSTLQNPSHAFSTTGSKTVSLTVGDASGSSGVSRTVAVVASSGFIINHLNTDLSGIPDAWIEQAKKTLHVAYGTASHGSQLVFGMGGIDAFLGTGSKYAFNSGGSGGALDFRGYIGNFAGLNIATSIEFNHVQSTCWTCWNTATRAYLPANPDVNVIMWAWCYGVNDGPTRVANYLAYMEALERDFPNVKFVYMTGRTSATGAYGTYDAVGNQMIRDYCVAHNKILYDFYDIECYDPDGTYYGDKLPDDGLNYDSNGDGARDSNWGTRWQNVNPGKWFTCESPHSLPITANMKAYAAWHLWARLAGWDGN